jgi:putative chitinase
MTPATLAAAIGCSLAKAELYAPHLDEACRSFAIDTPARLAAFLAQIGHESGSLQYTEELASGAAYEGRKDLGNTEPGDGKRYRGHGLIQTTGRYNHRATTNGLRAYGCPDFEADPDKLAEPRWAALSAAWYWYAHGCNELADAGDFEAITSAINGGLNGYEDRKRRWEKAKAVLVMAEAPQAPDTQANAPQAQPEAPMPFPALIAALLPSIVEAIPKLASIFKPGSEVAQRNVQAAELVVDLATKATNSVNAQEAVEKLKSDPVAVQAVQKAVEENWWQLSEAGGGGIEGARKADAVMIAAGTPVWRSPSFLISLALLPMMYLIVGNLIGLWGQTKLSEAVTGNLITGVITLVLGGIAGYYWGATTSMNKAQR